MQRLFVSRNPPREAGLFCLDVQIDDDVRACVVGADRLFGACFIFVSGPDPVIGIGRERSEAVASVAGGEKAADAVRLAVLEINDRAGDGRIVATIDLAGKRAGAGTLRESKPCGGQGKKQDRRK